MISMRRPPSIAGMISCHNMPYESHSFFGFLSFAVRCLLFLEDRPANIAAELRRVLGMMHVVLKHDNR